MTNTNIRETTPQSAPDRNVVVLGPTAPENWKDIEAAREPFQDLEFHYTQTKDPAWEPGTGATVKDRTTHETISIEPYSEGRSIRENYRLLLSAIIPRPIGLVSTLDQDGNANLAPFSWFNIMSYDPPTFVIGFSTGRGVDKDTLRNLLATGECTINLVSEWFQEAAHYTSINAPPGASEWALSGLTPAATKIVKAPRAAESAFSFEAKLQSHQRLTSRASGKNTGTICVVEAVCFHVHTDVMTKDGAEIDPAALKPVCKLGGLGYGRLVAGYELETPLFQKEVENGRI